MGAHFWPKHKIKEFFFHPLNIVELSQKKNGVCSGGKLSKRSQVLYRIFLKINQNYFAHICPEYGFRVNLKV